MKGSAIQEYRLGEKGSTDGLENCVVDEHGRLRLVNWMAIKEEDVSGWEKFEEKAKELSQRERSRTPASELLSRGQENFSWELASFVTGHDFSRAARAPIILVVPRRRRRCNAVNLRCPHVCSLQ